jgi:hypothetical protein
MGATALSSRRVVAPATALGAAPGHRGARRNAAFQVNAAAKKNGARSRSKPGAPQITRQNFKQKDADARSAGQAPKAPAQAPTPPHLPQPLGSVAAVTATTSLSDILELDVPMPVVNAPPSARDSWSAGRAGRMLLATS